jgi:hypothetical protein
MAALVFDAVCISARVVCGDDSCPFCNPDTPGLVEAWVERQRSGGGGTPDQPHGHHFRGTTVEPAVNPERYGGRPDASGTANMSRLWDCDRLTWAEFTPPPVRAFPEHPEVRSLGRLYSVAGRRPLRKRRARKH